MVLLSGLPLVSCSEKIKTVSVSGYAKVSTKQSTSLVAQYRNRSSSKADMSLHEYFFDIHSKSNEEHVPHYVGSSTTPRHPITEAYARAMLIIHKPWIGTSRTNPGSKINEFSQFLSSDRCPKSVKLAQARAKERYENGSRYKEPTAQNEDSGGTFGVDGIDQEAMDFLRFAAAFSRTRRTPDGQTTNSFHRGLDFNWGGKRNKVRRPAESFILQHRLSNTHFIQTLLCAIAL